MFQGRVHVFFVLPALFLTMSLASAQHLYIRKVGEAGLWTTLLTQAATVGLPTRFLRELPPDFISIEFADLRTFAAEYHPATHHMVLNRALSFNDAGRTLRPLAQLNHRDVATIYHELFHAYLDYLSTSQEVGVINPNAGRLLAFARDMQDCRYSAVQINPLPQKKTVTESRFLSERESWEALNETWAVFVGWAIWTKLEAAGSQKGRSTDDRLARAKFSKLLKKAEQSAELVGYYEPEDPRERAMTHKRYLAPSNRITRSEVTLLLEFVLGEDPREAARISSVMTPDPLPSPGGPDCPREK